MVPASTTIRAAGLDDAAPIGVCRVRSWQAAYAGRFPQSFLDGPDPDARAAGWRRYLETGDHDREGLLVAEVEGEVVGFASVGPCRDPDVAGAGLVAGTVEEQHAGADDLSGREPRILRL